MYARLDQQDPIPMIGMSATLPKVMQAHQKYQRQLHKTAKGIEVIETAIDPNMVMVIRDHAREVTQFVEKGMPVMRNGRMRRYA
jgi:phage terminase Nu1 subunit (DNA packaging protein)